MSKNIAVILSGGKGMRFGLDIPKQFAKLAGKSIIEHSIEAFEQHNLIDEICIVTHLNWKYLIEEYVLKNKYRIYVGSKFLRIAVLYIFMFTLITRGNVKCTMGWFL